MTLFLFIYAWRQSKEPLLRARVEKAGRSSNIIIGKMDGASVVAVVTTNCPFARIHNDFPSAGALKGAGTLADSSRFHPPNTHTHMHLMCHMETHTGEKKLNGGAKINKHTHTYTHTHMLSGWLSVRLLFPFTFALCWSREERQPSLPLSSSTEHRVI